MAEFQRVEIATEATELFNTAIETLETELAAKGVVGYKPSEADLEIILLGVISQMAADAAVVASTLLEAVFRKYGTELFKLAYNEGTYAKAAVTFTQLPEGGKYPVRTVEAGTQLEAGGLAFYIENTVTSTSEVATFSATVIAAERGTEYNGASNPISLVNSLSYIKEVSLVESTSAGTDQETDEQYLERLASILQLQAPRPITSGNYAELSLYGSSGVEVGRATAISGYNPATIKIEGTPTSAKTDLKEVTTFTGVSLEKASGAQTHPGSELHWEADGVGVYTVLARGTTMKAKLGAGEGELSKAALGTKAKGKIEVIGKYEEPRWVTVFVLGPKGATVSSGNRTKLKEYLEKYRELNFNIAVEPPSENEIQVKAAVHVLPGYTESAVVTNVKAAIETFLSPENWGNPNGTATGAKTWLNATEAYGVVRYNQLVGIIESVAGVAYVPAGSSGLAIGLEEAPGTKTADLTLAGPAPLTKTVAGNITVTAV